jgi:hypothetical protein
MFLCVDGLVDDGCSAGLWRDVSGDQPVRWSRFLLVGSWLASPWPRRFWPSFQAGHSHAIRGAAEDASLRYFGDIANRGVLRCELYSWAHQNSRFRRNASRRYTRAPAAGGRRGLELKKTPVHVAADGIGVSVFTPTTLRTAEAGAPLTVMRHVAVVAAHSLLYRLQFSKRRGWAA